MSNSSRAVRQLELLFKTLKPSEMIESEPVKKISTVYYYPNQKIVKVVPYEENLI